MARVFLEKRGRNTLRSLFLTHGTQHMREMGRLAALVQRRRWIIFCLAQGNTAFFRKTFRRSPENLPPAIGFGWNTSARSKQTIWGSVTRQSLSHRWVREILVNWSRNHLLWQRQQVSRNPLPTSDQPFYAISCTFLAYRTTFSMHSALRIHFWCL